MGAKLLSARPSRASTRRLPPQQTAISTFTKATKSGTRQPVSKDVASKKRKVGEIELEVSGSGSGIAGQDEQQVDARAVKVARLSRPSNSLSKSDSTYSSPSTSTRSATPLTPAKAITRDPSTSRNGNNTLESSSPVLSDINTDSHEISDSDVRPQSFHDFTNLHSSFLTALSLHCSHNGRSTPADLRHFLPSIEKIWKKRKVEKADLQKLLYVLENGPGSKGNSKTSGSPFRIANYGIGKTCLELLDANSSAKRFGPPFNEAELVDKFSRNLEHFWQQSLGTSGHKKHPNVGFIRTIPLVPIHDSATAFTSLRLGQQRLLDFKKGVVGLKAAVDSGSVTHNEKAASARSSGGGAAGRRNGLLQRIQNKQLKQTTLAPPPSKEAILRSSAVDLIEEVVGVLILLRPSCSSPSASASLVGSEPVSLTTSHKKPYRWDTITQNIRDSLRSPISKQEVEACLDLLAQPSVAGEWVSIVTVNRLKSVVLRSGCDISPHDIGMKVAHLKL
ncbi:hypothetical protein AJ79_09640 [Helicocarpus griseus UAMH5409]|uniref:DNA replication factor Cdt1 C-terminal domain-containing protein n=1 Tax=Helicocarpus griseus UAMH5409 TaxID=1447875 RepID=A0A2B7WI66_9EURO|nr:hypothetical protein AJ79_09640 [Helicocarpus griseus UAMH5409]